MDLWQKIAFTGLSLLPVALLMWLNTPYYPARSRQLMQYSTQGAVALAAVILTVGLVGTVWS